ncbi:MAG: hypothetical protein IJ838_03360 [Paludibacteraceae bacterium]|nr:hypothetical protein [Paludibacteraceae bacterium]
MKKVTLQEVLNGSIFTRAWFRRQYKLLGLIVLLLFLYVYAGYQAEKQHKQLGDLQGKLKKSRYELLTLQADLTDMTRQSSIAEELKKRNSPLRENKKPAIQLQP